MLSNTPCTPFLDETEEPFFVGQESWEAFIKTETENLSSRAPPAPGVSQMECEQPEDFPQRMEEYFIPYGEQRYFRNYVEEPDVSKMRRSGSSRLHTQYGNDFNERQSSACSRRNSEAEEAGSVSTRDSCIGEMAYHDNDGSSLAADDNVFEDAVSDFDMELKRLVANVFQEMPDEQKAYIQKIFPMLLNSVKETLITSQLPINQNIITAIVHELLRSKETMMRAEREVLNSMAQEELEEVTYDRPDEMITEEELVSSNRKEKRSTKGNRNGSSMNHLNENYASNIFQFAKRNYPEDRDVQKIANNRNVSASNFRRLVGAKMTDGILARRAKARIAENGRELVENIEYWMRDGYFEQCADREKYIYHKEKALRDLALCGNY